MSHPLAILTPEEIEKHLSSISGWESSEDMSHISRTFTFPSFAESMAFVHALARVAKDFLLASIVNKLTQPS